MSSNEIPGVFPSSSTTKLRTRPGEFGDVDCYLGNSQTFQLHSPGPEIFCCLFLSRPVPRCALRGGSKPSRAWESPDRERKSDNSRQIEERPRPAHPHREASVHESARAVLMQKPERAILDFRFASLESPPIRCQSGTMEWTSLQNLPPAKFPCILCIRRIGQSQRSVVSRSKVCFSAAGRERIRPIDFHHRKQVRSSWRTVLPRLGLACNRNRRQPTCLRACESGCFDFPYLRKQQGRPIVST